MTQLSVRTVQPVFAATVDTVACLARAQMTRFDTGEMILVQSSTARPVLRGSPAQFSVLDVESFVTMIDVRWSKESHLKTVRIHFAEP